MTSIGNMIRFVAEFTKTTLIGGVLVVAPVYLSIILLAKMLVGVGNLIAPVTQGLPDTLPFRNIIAILLIVTVCLICGAAIRTKPGSWLKRTLEHSLLEKIPGYTLMRGLASQIAGKSRRENLYRGTCRDRGRSRPCLSR